MVKYVFGEIISSEDNFTTKFNYNRMCQYINFTKTAFFLYFQSYFDQEQQFDLNILDSQSLCRKKYEFNMETPIELSWSNLGFAVFKYEKRLKSPYNSDCNSNFGYSQHECENDCFNNIIWLQGYFLWNKKWFIFSLLLSIYSTINKKSWKVYP